MLSSSQPSGNNKKCEPKQNNCSGAGTGPACDDPELGAYRKKVCLEDVRNRCEKKLEKCLEICKDTTEQAYRSFGRAPDVESRQDGVDDQANTGNGTVAEGIIPVWGYWWADAVWTPMKDNFIEPEYMAVGSTYSTGGRLSGGDFRSMPHPYLIMVANIDMCRDCYLQAMQQCETAPCYCSQLKCPFGPNDPGGTGIGGGDKDKPTYEDVNKGEINNASYETTSLYDIPIELVYTRSFLPGNVFLLTEPREVRKTKTTSVRDPVKNVITRTHTLIISNYSDLFIGVCAGEIGKVTRVFFDGEAVYEANNATVDEPGVDDMQFVTMTGSESQKVRGDHAKITGFGRTPAYRGLAYTVVKNFNFSAYDDFPTMKFEVVKKVDPPEQYIESATIPGLDASVWRIDGPANRIVVGTNTGVRILSLDDLSEVRSETIPNVLDVTPLGKVLTYDGARIGVYDPGMGEYGSFTPTLGITQSFVFRTMDTAGNAGVSLVSTNSGGDMMFEEIDDITPSFPTDSIAIKDLAGIDIAAPEAAVELYYEGDENRKSLFFARVLQGSPDIMRVREVRMFSTNLAERLLEDEQWYSYDLPSDAFGGTANLTLQGVIPCQTDGTLIFAYLASGTSGFLKWSPEEGVIWNVTMPSVPYLGKYAPTDNPAQKKFGYLANATTAYILDLVTGTYVTRTGTFAAPTGLQYYDSATSSIVYQSASNRVSRAFMNRVVPTMETLEMVAQDLAERAGIDRAYVNAADVGSIEVNGIRSGDNVSAADIIQQLISVYLAVPSAGDFLTLRRKVNNTYTQIDSNDLATTLDLSRFFERVQDKTVTVEYFSDNLDGDKNFQTFSLNSGDARSAEVIDDRYTYTVLEDDTYMKQLAEMFVSTDLNARDSYKVGLPPRYLALSTGDVIRVNGRYLRISEDSLGADNTLELTSVRDAPDDYAAYAPLVGTAGFGALAPNNSGSVAAPIFVSARAIDQQITPSIGVVVGASDILEEFTSPTTIGFANDEALPTVTGNSFSVNESLIWGRLEEMSSPLVTAVLKSFPSHSLAIRFPSAEVAQRVLDRPSRYGSVPDPRTEDAYYNTLIVGKEVIQYGYVLADPGDEQVVYFHNLIRGLHNTDDALDHVLGEMCVLVDTATARKYEIAGGDAGASVKLVAVKPKQGGRRGDATPYEPALYPVVPGYLMRQDFEITEPSYRSAAYPGNPAVMISFRQKGNIGYGLTEDSASQFEYGPIPYIQLSLYLLRAPYDPILFEAERNGVGTSYIVQRVPTMPGLASSSDYASVFDGAFKSYDLSYIWRGDLQTASQWNHLTEPIVAVLTSTNDYGESRVVFEWRAGGDYTRRPTRGLYGSDT